MPSEEEINLLQAITSYLDAQDIEHVRRVLDYARILRESHRMVPSPGEKTLPRAKSGKSERPVKPEKLESLSRPKWPTPSRISAT